MYSLSGFGRMIADGVRMESYAEALRRTVTPGCVVLDIGAGTGIMSLLACKLGARRVYAVEPSPASQLLQIAARDNGFADRITLLSERSTEVTLPERADVMVSDLRGVMPPYHAHLADIRDARARLLAPNGHQIPSRDRLFVAAVGAEQAIAEARDVWHSAPFGLDLRAALNHVNHTWTKHYAEPEALFGPPVCWAELDYTAPLHPHVKGECTLEVTRAGTAHGLLLWFDATLVDGVGFSNAPGAPRAIYGQSLHPWPEPLALEPGDRLQVELRADPVSGGYRWSWLTGLVRASAPDQVAKRFRQSDFMASLISPDLLRRRSEDFTPSLSAGGELTLRALERMRAGVRLGALAAELHASTPGRFASEEEALEFVADLSERHSR
jgi:protein arginine N-methyltransferase 1